MMNWDANTSKPNQGLTQSAGGGGSLIGYPTDTERTSAMSELDSLQGSLSQLFDVIQGLSQHLTPILRAVPPNTGAGQSATAQATTSLLVERHRMLRGGVEEMIRQVADIRNRAEV